MKAQAAYAPRWLRPAALCGALALHGFVGWLFVVTPATRASPQDAIEVTVAPLGDASEDRRRSAEASPDANPATPVVSTPAPTSEPTPEVFAPPPPAPSPAPSVAAEPEPAPPSPVATPEVVTPPPSPESSVAAEPAPIPPSPEPSVASAPASPVPVATSRPTPPRAHIPPEAKPVPKPTPRSPPTTRVSHEIASASASNASASSAAAQHGASDGSPDSSQASRASYAALLSAEIGRHKVYPEAARQRGATGVVGVRFTVGPNGRIVGHAVTRSSGDAELDAAVGAMMAAVEAPPPPGGRFVGDIFIRFDLR